MVNADPKAAPSATEFHRLKRRLEKGVAMKALCDKSETDVKKLRLDLLESKAANMALTMILVELGLIDLSHVKRALHAALQIEVTGMERELSEIYGHPVVLKS